MTSQIDKLRKEIEQIDEEIISLLARRFHLTGEVGKIKIETALEVQDTDRESNLLAIYEDLAMQKGLNPGALTSIFQKIFEESRADQELDQESGEI